MQCLDRLPPSNRFLFSDSEDETLLSASPTLSPKPAFSPRLISPALPPRGDKTLDIPRVHMRTNSNVLSPDASLSRPRSEVTPHLLLFELLSVEHVLVLVRVLLLERSVLFVSSQFSLLTAVMEALKDLL